MTVHPLVLVGAGPANLALAIYLSEELRIPLEENCIILECKPETQWHAGLCLSRAELQTSMLKDLVCLRDPTSHFTFLNFLRHRNLLRRYAHLNTFYPSRELYGRYLAWVSDHFRSIIKFGVEVTDVGQEHSDGNILFRVNTRSGTASAETFLCRKLVLAVGRQPFIPKPLQSTDAFIFHASELLTRFESLGPPREGKYVVVGAGQSAGEVVRYLMERSSRSRVHVISKGYLFRQLDDNPFVNDLYDDLRSKDFFELPSEQKAARLRDLRSTNYGVIERSLLDDLYQLNFDRAVLGLEGLALHSYADVVSAQRVAKGLHVEISYVGGRGMTAIADVDAVICATGYRDNTVRDLVRNVLANPGDAELQVDENFEARLSEGSGLFILNHSASSHGVTEGTMAGLAERMRRIGDTLVIAPNREVATASRPYARLRGEGIKRVQSTSAEREITESANCDMRTI
jgi:lysine/ornithine N-monooxygenase